MMALIERDSFLTALQTSLGRLADREGHSVFISGEAGMGKTSLVKTFCQLHKRNYTIYQGACDALFTPRPLAPLYDVIGQLDQKQLPLELTAENGGELFSSFFRVCRELNENTIIVFEDIHWADEATLDFIRFFARRITQLPCLFILTYRDNEIAPSHPLKSILGQLPPDSFSRMELTPFSKVAVREMADEKGFDGNEVYAISGGNPFYVTEILSSYSDAIPESVRDVVLSAYNRSDEKQRQIWELLSVIPSGFEIDCLEKMEPFYAAAIEACLQHKILIIKHGLIAFKHELFRRGIESLLSPLKRLALHRKILELLKDHFEKQNEIERIVHHARNANDYETVTIYAPRAAQKAAALGAHMEASKLFLAAIEYYQGKEKNRLLCLYEGYAYECYLTNQIREAIIYTEKSLRLLEDGDDIEKRGNTLRFLSRLWRFEGQPIKGESYALQAIRLLENRPYSAAKAMAFSNMSQIKMLSDELDQCIAWGEKAMDMARELGNEEILCHAMNNVGTALYSLPASREEGRNLLQQSLTMALANAYQEHVVRAYTNILSCTVTTKEFPYAEAVLREALLYCEEKDLDAWASFILSFKTRIHFEKGFWKEALKEAASLLQQENETRFAKMNALIVAARIKMRRGDSDVRTLLEQARDMALGYRELRSIVPTFVALLEYEWIYGIPVAEQTVLNELIQTVARTGNEHENSEFAFWLRKAKKQDITVPDQYEGYMIHTEAQALQAARLWQQAACPYEQAQCLFEANQESKKVALTLLQQLGATAVLEKMKQEMRELGIKSIPRGIRKSTQANPAFLTSRELDILQLLKEGLQNKEIASRLFISSKTVDHHISSILFKLEAKSRAKAVQQAFQLHILK